MKSIAIIGAGISSLYTATRLAFGMAKLGYMTGFISSVKSEVDRLKVRCD